MSINVSTKFVLINDDNHLVDNLSPMMWHQCTLSSPWPHMCFMLVDAQESIWPTLFGPVPNGVIHQCQLNDKNWHSYTKDIIFCFLAATKQLYDWFSPSVRPSVCPSVCPSVRLSVRHTFFTMFPSSYHHEIFRSYYRWQKWRPCKRSRSEVKGQGHRGHDPT